MSKKETITTFFDKDYNAVDKEKAVYYEETVLEDNKFISSTFGKVISIEEEDETK